MVFSTFNQYHKLYFVIWTNVILMKSFITLYLHIRLSESYFLNQLPIITKLVNSNSAHGEVYSIKFVSDLSQVDGFLRVLRFPPSIKLSATIKLKYRWNGGRNHNPNPSMDFFYVLYELTFGDCFRILPYRKSFFDIIVCIIYPLSNSY